MSVIQSHILCSLNVLTVDVPSPMNLESWSFKVKKDNALPGIPWFGRGWFGFVTFESIIGEVLALSVSKMCTSVHTHAQTHSNSRSNSTGPPLCNSVLWCWLWYLRNWILCSVVFHVSMYTCAAYCWPKSSAQFVLSEVYSVVQMLGSSDMSLFETWIWVWVVYLGESPGSASTKQGNESKMSWAQPGQLESNQRLQIICPGVVLLERLGTELTHTSAVSHWLGIIS